MKIDLTNFKSDLSNISRTIRFVYESDKVLCYVRLFLILVQSILPIASLFLLKKLVDAVTTTGAQNGTVPDNVWVIIALVSAVMLIIQVANVINSIVGEVLGQKIIDYINGILHSKSLELDLTYYDNPEYHDTFHRAQQEATYRPIQILNSISQLIQNVISFLGIAAILASLSWYILVIMIIAGVPSLLIKMAKTKMQYIWRKENTSDFRKVSYYSQLMTHRLYAKEMRIFTLGSYIQSAYEKIRISLINQIIILSKKQAIGNVSSSLFEIGALTISIVLLTNKFYAGSVSIGGFVMFFAAVRNANSYLNGIISNLTAIYNNKLFLSNLFEFINLQPNIRNIENPVKLDKISKGIELKNVSFRYEGGSKQVLKDINLSIKPGETVLITGKNGAGKTTLINLLCRMYEASGGSITFDGVDIKDIEIHSLHKKIGIVLQDYCKYNLTVKENIMFGDVDKEHDINAVAELSGATQFVHDLPNGFDTMVGKFFKDGEELSIGQWQKLALSRAFYGESDIIILDEPTASIDLETEDNFFQTLSNSFKDKIIIIIGHKITGKVKADNYYNLQKGTLTKVSNQFAEA
ncbi:MAG: ABC transporter ATP-binding protein [Flavobacteriales bacterium]|nr:ABC transporter ATP-binding protein [Flavobacteriales bacterium]